MIGVIPAAGRGTRAYPYTKGIPKSMLEVEGEPNLARIVALMRDQLGIGHIVIVIGHFGAVIRSHFGDGSRFGVRITYVENREIEKGLSYSILLSRPYVDDYFCVILGDECYVASNHAALLDTPYRDYLATCGVATAHTETQLLANYAVHVEGGLIRRMVEKPRLPCDGLLGLGTFLLAPSIYDYLEAALALAPPVRTDPVSVLGRLCRSGAPIAPFQLSGDYVNINDRDALNLANNLVRSRGFSSRTVTAVLLRNGSEAETRRTLEEFRSSPRIADVLLVTPPGPAAEGLPAGVRRIPAPSAGYGDMMRAGLDAAEGDILVTALSDGSFCARDLPKFLDYITDADLVVGTRTTRQLIEQGTNMRGVVRLAHILLAKLLELVWWSYEPRFTDLGCAYRAIWRSTYRTIRPALRSRGPEYAVELLLETLRCRKRVIEIPISYRLPRPGVREPQQTIRTFITAAALTVARRFGPPR